ncbi:hypothetical protein G9272_42890 [Streptomyces asoensis]|uniref:Uncharacterized protein n=1 Tax=Streptomyces asoensis TaxID=249586 RepID=A0A6M4X7E4_9ACTN|nr:hypothetical protein [Streptomyces asoensis]QJT06236.1 hypothetical protein G9272_42890 [Streptomyces asoensis]
MTMPDQTAPVRRHVHDALAAGAGAALGGGSGRAGAALACRLRASGASLRRSI